MTKEDYIGQLIENKRGQLRDEFDQKKAEYFNNLIKEKDKEIEQLNNIIDELKWKPISQYDNGNHDWVLIKMFIKEDNYECVPIVAEKRMGVWRNQDGEALDEDMFEIKYFMDMQQLDTLKELKEGE